MANFGIDRNPDKGPVSTEVGTSSRVFGVNETRKANVEAAAKDARKRSNKASASKRSHKRDFEQARAYVRTQPLAPLIDFLYTQPMGLLEMYLLAEEAEQRRSDILGRFPKPGVKARSRWLPESLAPVGA